MTDAFRSHPLSPGKEDEEQSDGDTKPTAPSGVTVLDLTEALQQQEAKDPAEVAKFAASRKHHYNMRDALALGNRLIEDDEEEEEEDRATLSPPTGATAIGSSSTPREHQKQRHTGDDDDDDDEDEEDDDDEDDDEHRPRRRQRVQ